MRILLVMLLIFVVLLAVLLGLSVGVAFLSLWLLPAVGLGMALLVAVIAVGQVMLIFGRLMSAFPENPELEGESQPPIVILDREVALPRRRRKGHKGNRNAPIPKTHQAAHALLDYSPK